MLASPDDSALASFVGRRLENGAHALDLNAGIDGQAHALLAAATRVRVVAPGTPLFLDTGDPAALASVIARAPAPVVANAVVLGDDSELALLEAIARAEAGAVLSPRGFDEAEPLPVDALVERMRAGVDRARAAGVAGPLYLDALAYPPAFDPWRWRRSVEIARAMPEIDAAVLLAIGNVGHGSPPELRPWLRLVTLALAVGAGARALILPVLPVLEGSLVHTVPLLEGRRAPVDDVDRWLIEVAEVARQSVGGTWPSPPPASAPHALLEAWAICLG